MSVQPKKKSAECSGLVDESLADLIKRKDIAILPCGDARDLDDEEVNSVSSERPKTLAKHWRRTFASYNPCPASGLSPNQDSTHLGERHGKLLSLHSKR